MTSRLAPSQTVLLIVVVSAALVLVARVSADTLVEAGVQSNWKFLDDGTEPSSDWCKPRFPDEQWKSGQAPLGYGDPGIRTTVGFGGNAASKHITTYFRQRFVAKEPNRFVQLLVFLRVDDGAVIYLNGKEIARENLPAGRIEGRTMATRAIDGAQEWIYHRFAVPVEELAEGDNVIAAEVHQCRPASSDIVLDLVLKAYREGQQPQPARASAQGSELSRLFSSMHYIPARMVIPDGYVDGGRRSDAEGAGGVREVLVVDRKRDSALQKHIAFARSDAVSRLPPVERAQSLARYVDREYSPPDGREYSELATNLLQAEYRGAEMLLGNSSGAGVCRHRSLLFKIMADEAGLDVALARGNLGGSGGAHAWNELSIENGKKLIVDCMNPSRDFELEETTAPAAKRYRTVKNEPYYPAASQP